MITALVLIFAVAVAYYIGYKVGVKSVMDRIEEAIWLERRSAAIEALEERDSKLRTTNAFRRHLGLEPLDE